MNKLIEYEKFDEAMDIVITIPKTVKWSDYERELEAASSGEVMNFKVAHFPRTGVGSRCYVVHEDFVRGYMIISGLSEKEFECTTTGREWRGKFVERTGEFHRMEESIPMKGFQGFRYFK